MVHCRTLKPFALIIGVRCRVGSRGAGWRTKSVANGWPLRVGRDKVIAHLESTYSNPHIVRSEYLNPAVSVADSGDFAVLAYNLNTYVLDDNGNERQRRAWNATEAYRLIDGEWHIVHSNWAFTKTATGAIAS
ncbi:nuclear transport factor 2 family protein [Nonomuraea sp. 10N515B]|uniref:nuclear transport factor 2 family protein n=1 Tax=Nonomuraea sp. 10N515B TaxID=3457422 RepID=UPI003FCEBCF3